MKIGLTSWIFIVLRSYKFEEFLIRMTPQNTVTVWKLMENMVLESEKIASQLNI